MGNASLIYLESFYICHDYNEIGFDWIIEMGEILLRWGKIEFTTNHKIELKSEVMFNDLCVYLKINIQTHNSASLSLLSRPIMLNLFMS